jgi:hypothetical protein
MNKYQMKQQQQQQQYQQQHHYQTYAGSNNIVDLNQDFSAYLNNNDVTMF